MHNLKLKRIRRQANIRIGTSQINDRYIKSKKSVVVVSDNTPKAISSFTTYYRFIPIQKVSKTNNK